jgi:hypothetical protein
MPRLKLKSRICGDAAILSREIQQRIIAWAMAVARSEPSHRDDPLSDTIFHLPDTPPQSRHPSAAGSGSCVPPRR